MSKKLIVLLSALMMGLALPQEPATSSTASISVLGKRSVRAPEEATASTSTSSSGKRARKAPVAATVEAHFVPQENIINELFNLLDNAQKQVLIAVYWITSDDIIDKLISLRDKIDIQIIFDESSSGSTYLVNKLLSNKIKPIVYPSGFSTSIKGIMHNKFIIIDNKIVLTGSPNLTLTALGASNLFNYENIVIIHSDDIAQEYHQAFSYIKEKTLDLYVKIIANNNPNQLHDWMNTLLPKFYEYDHKKAAQNYFNTTIYSQWHHLQPIQKNRLRQFFKWKLPSQQQINELNIQNIEHMSSQHAFKLIADEREKRKEAKRSKRKSNQNQPQ